MAKKTVIKNHRPVEIVYKSVCRCFLGCYSNLINYWWSNCFKCFPFIVYSWQKKSIYLKAIVTKYIFFKKIYKHKKYIKNPKIRVQIKCAETYFHKSYWLEIRLGQKSILFWIRLKILFLFLVFFLLSQMF